MTHDQVNKLTSEIYEKIIVSCFVVSRLGLGDVARGRLSIFPKCCRWLHASNGFADHKGVTNGHDAGSRRWRN